MLLVLVFHSIQMHNEIKCYLWYLELVLFFTVKTGFANLFGEKEKVGQE